MGIRDNIRNITESIFRVRIVPRETPADNMSITTERDSLTNRIDEALETGKRIDLTGIQDLMSLKQDRNEQYRVYEEMVADGRIGAAVEMYANDATQIGPDGRIIWVESDSADVAAYGNKIIDDLNIEANIWTWAYCLWLYGDVYLELFENTSELGTRPTLLTEPINHNTNVQKQVEIDGAYLERYIEKVPNPADIYDLQFKGKTSGYVRSKEPLEARVLNKIYNYSASQTSNKIQILSPMKFIHICLSPNINRFPERFSIIRDDPTKKFATDKAKDTTASTENSNSEDGAAFTVLRGQSILENVYGPYQTLKLKEDSVLLERVTKSSITRIIQVELGDLPEAQKERIVRDLKEQIEQQLLMNKETGTLSSRAGAQPTENIIYTTTKNGKGVISTVNIGGDVDIGSLEDLTQSENKVYGALLIPKALLGADMDGSGLSNGGSLTEMNTTYARRIKRGQTAIISAIQTLIDIFALRDGFEDSHVGNFTVKMTPIITVEDTRRDELLGNKIRNISDIMTLLSGEMVTDEDRLKIIAEVMVSYLSQQDIADILNEVIDRKEEEKLVADTIPDEDEGSETRPSRPSMPRPSSIPTETPEEKSNVPDFAATIKPADEIDLSEIEGEDLV